MLNMKSKFGKQVKICIGVILLQFGFAGFAIVAKFALNQGTSHYTFSVYRNAIAAVVFAPFAVVLERKIRPKMTFSIFCRIMLLGLLDPVIGQNLFYAGMDCTTATFTTAMCNVLPGLTFLIAWILRVEKVYLKRLHSRAKLGGTLITIGGAMIMTLIGGPALGLPWTKHKHTNTHSSIPTKGHYSPMKGAIMIVSGNICYALFYILQHRGNTTCETMTMYYHICGTRSKARLHLIRRWTWTQSITLESYPAGLSLTTLICTFGALQGAALTLVVERGNTSIWSVGWGAKLLAYAYGGIISSGFTYYVSGIIMKEKGPVFLTAFNPLNMVIVAILSSFIFAEQLKVGKIAGALVIMIGLYLVIWGKSRDQIQKLTASSKQRHQDETQATNINPSSCLTNNSVQGD